MFLNIRSIKSIFNFYLKMIFDPLNLTLNAGFLPVGRNYSNGSIVQSVIKTGTCRKFF